MNSAQERDPLRGLQPSYPDQLMLHSLAHRQEAKQSLRSVDFKTRTASAWLGRLVNRTGPSRNKN